MKKSTITFAIAFIVILSAAIVGAAITATKLIQLSGSITAVNVDVYTDAACTIPATALNVGNINPGASATQTIYIKNTGNVAETLTMAASNWVPTTANTVLTLTWDRQNMVLAANQVTPATLTLTAASNTGSLTAFSCSVTVTGTQ